MTASSSTHSASVPMNRALNDATILIIDDQPTNITVIQRYLELAGYKHGVGISDPKKALASAEAINPQLILLDIMMPDISGLTLLEYFRNASWSRFLPIIIVTAAEDRDTKRCALESGATDFLGKPIDPVELIPRIRNALMIKEHQDSLKSQADELERLVAERTASLMQRTRELEASRLEVICCLGRASEFRDNETGHHVVRVGRYVGMLSRAIGLDEETAKLYELAAPLHDVGKIGVPDAILLKPDRLTPDEFEVIKQHCGFGKRTLDVIPNEQWQAFKDHTSIGEQIFSDCQSPVLKTAATIALTHHEHWDGNGYPLRLAGENIPLPGRITAIADVFDALSSKRPYKQALTLEECFEIMRKESGRQFDPTLLDAFFGLREQIIKTLIELADTGAPASVER